MKIEKMKPVTFDEDSPGVVLKVKIKPGYNVYRGMQVIHFRDAGSSSDRNGSDASSAPPNGELKKLKVHDVGTVKTVLVKEGDMIEPGAVVFTMEPCRHPTVMKEMCAECGADLQTTGETKTMAAAIPIVHNIPELMVPFSTVTSSKFMYI
jgi:RNA polymerase II subunit A-like phosphatase